MEKGKRMKSIEEIMSNIVWTTGSTSEVKKKIKELEETDPRWDAESERSLWIRWGRKQLPQRILNTACLVITRATYGETTKMGDIKSMSLGASHNTMFTLLDHFSQLCIDKKWPFYPSCITDKDGVVPSGCLAWLIKNGHLPSVPVDHIKTVQEECFKSVFVPNGHEVALAVAEHIYLYKL